MVHGIYMDDDLSDVIFIGRSRTPPLRDTIFLLRTDKSSYTITIDYNPNAGTKSSNCLSVMPAGSYPAMRALK